MSRLKVVALFLLALWLPGCGRALVEFALDTHAAPTVTSTLPARDATGVALDTSVAANFSQAMDRATVSDGTLTLRQGTTEVAGAVSLDAASDTVTFRPSTPLSPDLVYTATVSADVLDTLGRGLAASYVWSFTTVSAVIVIDDLPTVTSTAPAADAVEVSVNIRPSATFSEAMDAATLNGATFTLRQGVTSIAGGVSLDAATNRATFTPEAALVPGLVYSASITTAAHDLAGQGLATRYNWSFTTTAAIGEPPTITVTTPAAGDALVPVNTVISATFSNPMDAATINDTTFTLTQVATGIEGSVSYDVATRTATFTLDAPPLEGGLTYTASISSLVTDSAGLPLGVTYTWAFGTAPVIVIDAPPTVSSTDPDSNEGLVAINTTVAATFSEPMAEATITDVTFTLSQDGNDVPASVLYDAGTATATLTPDDDLDFGLSYTASISTVVTDAAGIPLVVAHTWSFTTIGDLVPPSIESRLPDEGDIDVAINTNVTVTFSERMAGVTLNDATFTLLDDVTLIDGAVSLDVTGTTATFNPDFPLEFSTVYTVTLSGLVTDAAGNALVVPVTWDFTTRTDNDPPGVDSTVPVDGTQLVSVATSISVTFDEAMATASIDDVSFTLLNEGDPVAGTVSLDLLGTTATFVPDLPLSFDSQFTATINTLATDLEGNPLAIDVPWSFTTELDPNPPVVFPNFPLNLATEVSINTRPRATFSRNMDETTINELSFLLAQGLNPPIDGVVTYDPDTDTATFDPVDPLDLNLEYTATITTSATAVGGTPLVANFVWTFTTAACSQEPVALGNAGHFAVLAGSTVTSTGPTQIIGDLGVSPNTAIVGFGPGTVDGDQEAGTPVSLAGNTDLTVAFNDARDRVLCPVSKSGNLGGQTLPPGLYKSTDSLAIDSGDLTLDGLGDPDAVFIFQMASTLTTTGARAVILINEANPANIFWQVGSSATLGTTSVFFGTIMADQSVTLETGATLEGRALARIGAVTLDSNPIQLP